MWTLQLLYNDTLLRVLCLYVCALCGRDGDYFSKSAWKCNYFLWLISSFVRPYSGTKLKHTNIGPSFKFSVLMLFIRRRLCRFIKLLTISNKTNTRMQHVVVDDSCE